MLPMPSPKEAVRDLLGITRALHRADLTNAPPDRGRLERLQRMPAAYGDALEMGLRCSPESLGRRSALATRSGPRPYSSRSTLRALPPGLLEEQLLSLLLEPMAVG